MKYLVSFLALLLSYTAIGQVSINAVHGCTSYTLSATVAGITPTDLGLYTDDSYTDVENIGFNFKFYGTTYSQFLIGENGMVTFDLTLATGYCPWSITGPLLGNTNALNSICGPWCDIDGLTAMQPVYYSLTGTAPNRVATLTWCGVYMFSCTTQWTTTQIQIYESSNNIEVHVGHKTICSGWNGGAAIIGVQNAAGTAATVAPGRDYPTMWSTPPTEAWRFTPDISGTFYTVTSIPYNPIPYSAATIYWYDSTTGAYLGSGPTLNVTPTGPTTYKAAAVSCNDTSYAYIDVLPTTATGGGIPNISAITATNPTVCGLCDGTVTLHGVTPHQTDTIFYSLAGVAQPLKVDSAGADSTITITGLCAGVYDYFYVKVGDCPSNQLPATLVNPSVTASFTATTHLGCNGDTVVFTNSSTPVGYNSSWAFGDGGTSTIYSPTHIYADQATYTGTYTATLTYYTYPGCAATYTVTNTFNHPVAATFTADAAMMCLGLPDSFRNNSTGGIVSSLWNFGNGDSTLVPGTGTIGYTYPFGGLYTTTLTVTDTVGCQKSAAVNLTVISIDVHTAIHDTSVCLADSLLLPTTVMVPPGTVDSISYEWVSASGAPGTNLSDPYSAAPLFMGIGTYTYYFIATTHPLNCNASDSVTIHSYPPVTMANVTPSPQTVAYGSSIQLNADSAVFYNWVPNNGTLNDPNINDPIATPTDSVTVYTVYGMTHYGCLDSAKVTVYVDFSMTDNIPTAFTPNNDGLNDVFRISSIKFQKLLDFRVFNRWGQMIFQTNNVEKGWDGTFNGQPQDMGTYGYEITVAHSDGTQKTYKGSVTLIR